MYKEQIYKEASAKYVKGIKGITRAASKFSGKSAKEGYKVVKDNLKGGGTGSFYGDMVLGLFKKIPGKYSDPVKRKAALSSLKKMPRASKKAFKAENADILKRTKPLASKIDNVTWRMKSKLDDVDMAIGSKIGKKNRIFDAVVDINHGVGKDGSETIQRLKTKRLTAPLSKTKKAVLPMVGAMTIGDKLSKNKQQKEGEILEQ